MFPLTIFTAISTITISISIIPHIHCGVLIFLQGLLGKADAPC